MSALCADRVSRRRIGSAYELISWSRPVPVGYSSAVTSAIRPCSMRTCTCTGPQTVLATEPLTTTAFDVPDVAEPRPDADGVTDGVTTPGAWLPWAVTAALAGPDRLV